MVPVNKRKQLIETLERAAKLAAEYGEDHLGMMLSTRADELRVQEEGKKK